jgi:hypothetical protein
VYTSQHEQYNRGKFLRILPEAILKKDGHLVRDVDYKLVSKGSRNPYRSAVHPKTGEVYYGDVGSSVWEVRGFLSNTSLISALRMLRARTERVPGR